MSRHRGSRGAQVLRGSGWYERPTEVWNSHPLLLGDPFDTDITAATSRATMRVSDASDFAAQGAIDSGGQRDLLPARTEQQGGIQQSIFHVVDQ